MQVKKIIMPKGIDPDASLQDFADKLLLVASLREDKGPAVFAAFIGDMQSAVRGGTNRRTDLLASTSLSPPM